MKTAMWLTEIEKGTDGFKKGGCAMKKGGKAKRCLLALLAAASFLRLLPARLAVRHSTTNK
jgi:hypothetical protein